MTTVLGVAMYYKASLLQHWQEGLHCPFCAESEPMALKVIMTRKCDVKRGYFTVEDGRERTDQVWEGSSGGIETLSSILFSFLGSHRSLGFGLLGQHLMP